MIRGAGEVNHQIFFLLFRFEKNANGRPRDGSSGHSVKLKIAYNLTVLSSKRALRKIYD